MQPEPDQIRTVPLFSGLDDEVLRLLASWMEVERYDQGWRVTHEGGSGYSFFVLAEGTVEIKHDGRTVATLEPGDVFGEMAMILDGHRKADAIAQTEIEVYAMFGTRFREMQAQVPEVAEKLDELATERASMLD